LYINHPSTDNRGLFAGSVEQIVDLTIVNSYINGGSNVGGFSGDASNVTGCTFSGFCYGSSYKSTLCGGITGNGGLIQNCINYGQIKGTSCVGGITGSSYSTVSSCKNYGTVTGTEGIGGIAGYNTPVDMSINFGSVSGRNYVGGILGGSHDVYDSNGSFLWSRDGSVSNSLNYGTVTGSTQVGGIVGLQNSMDSTIKTSMNYGIVSGSRYVGGICGEVRRRDVASCANLGHVSGYSNVGGILGYGRTLKMCYNIGSVSVSTPDMPHGALLCWDDTTSNPVEITDSYYLYDRDLSGCGGLSADPTGVKAGFSSSLQSKYMFNNWDFEDTWSISKIKNGGYPYLKCWEDVISDLSLAGIALPVTNKSVALGDIISLTPIHSPSIIAAPEYRWESSDPSVIQVSQDGRIEAVGVGSSVVTLSGGTHTATCTITVDGRTSTDYRLNSLTLRTGENEPLSSILESGFWADIALTKLAENGNAVVLLAAYDEDGRFVRMLCAAAEDLIQNQSVTFSLYLNNSSGEIASLKAFAVSSLGNLTPLCAAIEF